MATKENRFKRFADAKAAMANPVRTETADAGKFKYKYATLAAVNEIVDPVLHEHGFDCIQWLEGTTLHTTVIDVTSDELNAVVHDTRACMEHGDEQAKGSSQTYQSRYAKLLVMGLAPVDDDGAGAVRADSVRDGLNKRLDDAIKTYKRWGAENADILNAISNMFGEKSRDQLSDNELAVAAAYFENEITELRKAAAK